MSRVAFVTGASGAIGSAVVTDLVAREFIVVRVSRSLPNHSDAQGASFTCDVTDPAAIADTIDEVVRVYGHLDVAVLCAGAAAPGRASSLTSSSLQDALSVNLMGVVNTCSALARIFREQRSGSLIHIGTLRAFQFSPNRCAYSTAKAAARAYVMSLGGELQSLGVDTTIVNPGFVDTPFYGSAARRPWTMTQDDTDFTRAPLLSPEALAEVIGTFAELPCSASVNEVNIGRLWAP
ncbi:MAG: SDR family oxidoreductase [Coriobacteriia bacterium]|nr:SDR family oxidoreductase [Coriobacteriia bacterium]